MALQYVGGASGTGTGATYSVSLTSLTGGIASSAAADDLVIVVTGWASTANGDPGVTTTGYTEVYDLYANDTRDINCSVNWKKMGGTPDTSVTVRGFNNAANGGATVVHVWRGADTTTPMDVTPPTGATGTNGSRPNSPSITPITSGAFVLTVGMGTGDASPQTFTAPTGYGNSVSVAGTGSTMSSIACVASKAWVSGAEDPGAWTGGETTTSDSWAAGTLAIRPAPTGPAPLIADSGSFVWTGVSASLLKGSEVGGEAGAYSWSGIAANLEKGSKLVADSTSYSWSAPEVIFRKGINFTADTASFMWGGLTASLLVGHASLTAGSGSYNLSGVAAKCLMDNIHAEGGAGSTAIIMNE